MSRWSKSWYTLTQWKNLAKHRPLLYRCHFGPHSTWQLILANLQASLHACTTCTQLQVCIKLWYGIDNPGEVGSTAVYPPSWIRVNSCNLTILKSQWSYFKGWSVHVYVIHRTLCMYIPLMFDTSLWFVYTAYNWHFQIRQYSCEKVQHSLENTTSVLL